MGWSSADKCLTSGLRALKLLAAYAPLDLTDFAALNGLSHGQALNLLGALEQTGYVTRVCDTRAFDVALFVLTPLALDMLPCSCGARLLN